MAHRASVLLWDDKEEQRKIFRDMKKSYARAEIHPTIVPKEGDVVIEKGTPDAFHKTTLHQKLKPKGIEKLIITGLQTEYCIDTTCRRAYSLGYNVVLVKDAHSTWDSSNLAAEQIIEHHNQVLGGWFVTLKNENEIKF